MLKLRLALVNDQDIASVNEAMEELGDRVNGTSETLARNMEAIEEATRRLATTLSALTPVLDQLAGPMEVRVMPKAITPPRMQDLEGRYGGAEPDRSGSSGSRDRGRRGSDGD